MKAASGRGDQAKFIENMGDINRLRSALKEAPRDLLFFELAIRTGLHAKDILRLTVADLMRSTPGQELEIHSIPKASNRIFVSPAIHRIFSAYVSKANLSGGDYL